MCTKHLKDNVTDYLTNKVGVAKDDRVRIVSKIFGPTGLVRLTDRGEYDDKVVSILDDYEGVYPRFAAYMDKRLINTLRKHVTEPLMTQSNDDLWTNNNCESINHVLKLTIDWKPQLLPLLIDGVRDVVSVRLNDLRAAMHGIGNYRLVPDYQRHFVPTTTWRTLDETDWTRLFRKLLQGCRAYKNSSVIVATDCDFRIPNVANVAKKPGQRTIPAATRAKKLPISDA